MKLKKQIASVLACGMLLASVPTEAMAYETPEIVRVGLESVCKNASSATIGVWYRDGICPPYAECCNDDDLVLYFSKKL